tara:strand:- start:60 stop:1007 length:948 start_codon:yes stop_codon:yes gene_type:complete
MKRLIGLDPTEYEHPEDRDALDKLESIPGVRKIAFKIWEVFLDKVWYIQSTGSFVEVNKENSPKLYSIFINACEILDFDEIPPLYINNAGDINAFAIGVNRPFVALSYHCIERLNDSEMSFILGHELGHIKSGHVLYRSIARKFQDYLKQLNLITLGLANFPAAGVEIAMSYWSRMSELTSDRAGLLVCKDLDAAITGIIKLSGFPSNDCSRISYLDVEKFKETFKKQARDFESFELEKLNKVVRFYVTKDMSHPWLVLRASELIKWLESGEFDHIINKERLSSEEKTEINFCSKCRSEIKEEDKFCGKCGCKLI